MVGPRKANMITVVCKLHEQLRGLGYHTAEEQVEALAAAIRGVTVADAVIAMQETRREAGS